MKDGEPSLPDGVIPPEQLTGTTPPKKNKDFSRFGLHLHLERRLTEPPRWYPFAVSGGAVLVALFFGGIVIALAGGNPFASYFHIVRASFGDWNVFSDTIVKATPLILVGLACSLAFRMRLWNIGAEGQFFLGAFGASLVVYLPILPENTSPWLFIPTMMVFGVLAGALWGFIPGFLKTKFNVNEIISTLMMNYIAINWNDFFIFAVWGGGFQLCPMFPQ
ncbi:MAG: hypothetical protein MUC85_11995, partial [Anaerolineales bacterium]|nr:hypothetical protein [Anaerolineales bacterium]